MMAVASFDALKVQSSRQAVIGQEPRVFTDIYQDETNMAIWQRNLPLSLQKTVSEFVALNPTFQASMTLAPTAALARISETLGSSGAYLELSENLAELVDMFSCLFELKRVGLRLTVLNTAMCPKFHVDVVPCRLITTYQGAATQWLPHHLVDRTKLGRASYGVADEQSGLFQSSCHIEQLRCGDVALLKGEAWSGNEGAGLVHRSPSWAKGDARLLLTLDFSD